MHLVYQVLLRISINQKLSHVTTPAMSDRRSGLCCFRKAFEVDDKSITEERSDPGADMRPMDSDILSIEEVSDLIRCAVDTVRRIPRDRLPVYRPGKRNLYLREDVIRYVRSCRVQDRAIEELVSEVEREVLDSTRDDVRERSRRRTR